VSVEVRWRGAYGASRHAHLAAPRRRADPTGARECGRRRLRALADHRRGPPVDRFGRHRHELDRAVDDDAQAARELGGLDRRRCRVRLDVPVQGALPDGAAVHRVPRARRPWVASVEAQLRGGPRGARMSLPPRIVFTGPESTGKTTLSRTLA